MKGESEFIPDVVPSLQQDFDDFDIGQGYVDGLNEARVRIGEYNYIHINDSTVQCNDRSNWPFTKPVRVRRFRLILKEI